MAFAMVCKQIGGTVPVAKKIHTHSLSLHNPLIIGFQKLLVRSAGFFVGLYPQKLHLNIRQAKWLFKLFLERHSIFCLSGQTTVCSVLCLSVKLIENTFKDAHVAQ